MKDYTLQEVLTKQDAKAFLDLARTLYKGDPNFVCPLDPDIEKRFDPKRNELFENGEAIRWIARDAQGKVVGRIAAFYNRAQAAIYDQPTGGCGFFECVDNQEVANMLFDAARDWLASKGMEAMDGPVNFGDRSDWWGVLVDGFTEPLYCNPYNPPYYQALFENYGFQNYFNQYTFYRSMAVGELNPAAVEKAERLFSTPGYRFEYAHRKDLGSYAEDFRTIYNGAWAKFTGVNPIDAAHARALMDNMKPIVDRRLLIFAYYEDQPIGFFVMVPDLNRIVGRFNGKFGLWQKLRLLYLLKCKKASDRIFAIIFGVLPEFQGKGVEGGLIRRFEIEVEKGDLPYKSLELAWVGDFNPVMIRFVESYVCAKKFKTHVTYRYLFDREKPFERAPRMGRSKPVAAAAAPVPAEATPGASVLDSQASAPAD